MSEIGEGSQLNPAERNDVDYRKLPMVGGRISAANELVGEIGLSGTANRVLEQSGIHVSPIINEEAQRVLAQQPVLIVATHPDMLNDTLGILGALPPERSDIYVLGSALESRLGPNIAEHIIRIHGVAQQQTENTKLKMARKLLMNKLQLHDNRSIQQIGRANIPSLNLAQQRLEEGGIVLVFPEGSKEEGGEWYSGVGKIVQQSAVKRPDAQIIFAKTEGQKWRNRGRLISSKAGYMLGEGNLKVYFSEPHEISEYEGQKREITAKLRVQYDEFLPSGSKSSNDSQTSL